MGAIISLRTKAQLRAARAMVEWSQTKLADRSGVSRPTIKRLEPGQGALVAQHATVMALESALETAGVEFIAGRRPGVRMKEKHFTKEQALIDIIVRIASAPQ